MVSSWHPEPPRHPAIGPDMDYTLKPVTLSLRSRLVLWLMRRLLRPWLAYITRGSPERLARAQLLVASRPCGNSAGLPLEYRVVGRGTVCAPGHVLGNLADTHKAAVLYLHGGAFILPAAPDQHVRMVAKLCRELDAVVDYRLAPANKHPAALAVIERAYRALLDLGFNPARIALAGESAGGNLVLGLLQRIRKAGLPMPCCAVPISPGTETGRLHAPPSRVSNRRRDPILPIGALWRISEFYVGTADTSDPELSPLYADLHGFPPLYLIATDSEVLLDDTLLLAQRAREAGVATTVDVWPLLPHAFPVMETVLPEGRQARKDMAEFIRAQLARRPALAVHSAKAGAVTG
jgi:epsilon-lactone hydrolase